MSRALPVLLAGLLASCSVTTVETPDTAAIPSGPIEARGEPATGPIVELGSGVTEGVGWRHSIYRSDDGWCTQLEMAGVSSSGCGPLPSEDGEVFGGVGQADGLAPGVTVHEGLVSDEVVTVWMVIDGGGLRVPARQMSLEEAGLDGSAFLGIVPDDVRITHLLAVAMNGEILQTYELP